MSRIGQDRLGRHGQERALLIVLDGVVGVDIAGQIFVAGVDAQGEPIVDRQVDHPVDIAVGPAGAKRAGDGGIDPGVIAAGVGLVMDRADRAAFRIGPEERALWPSQDLDPLDIGELEIDEDRDFVDVVGDRRRRQIGKFALAHPDIVGRDAPDDEIVVQARAALAIVGGLQTHDLVAQLGEVIDSAVGEDLAADRADIIGNFQNILGAPGGGDHHFAEVRSLLGWRGRRVRRRLRRGRLLSGGPGRAQGEDARQGSSKSQLGLSHPKGAPGLAGGRSARGGIRPADVGSWRRGTRVI